MPRYIDLEELEKRINEHIKPENLEEKALIEWCKDECIRQAYCMPTADVAPKSEVEMLRAEKELVQAAHDSWRELYNTDIKALSDNISRLIEELETAQSDVAREIFAEIEKLSHRFMNDKHYIFGDMIWDIAELKKKYTEGQK